MSDPIVILTEEPLGADDRVNIEPWSTGGDAPLVVLVPANTERHLLVDFLENLSMLDIAKAFRELTAHAPDPAAERAAAAETLAASLRALDGPRRRGFRRDRGGRGGQRPGGQGQGTRRRAGRRHHPAARRADTFHTDWANKAQDKLGLPVLHLYAGSGFIGDS